MCQWTYSKFVYILSPLKYFRVEGYFRRIFSTVHSYLREKRNPLIMLLLAQSTLIVVNISITLRSKVKAESFIQLQKRIREFKKRISRTKSLAFGIVEGISVVETQGVTKRCRLSWLTNRALVYEPKCGVTGGVAGSQPMSTAVHREPK
jgi:hypothetical protein